MAIASSMETVRGYRGEKKVVKPEVSYAHRDVMRSGPVLLEKENGEVRKPWDLFTEYCSKAKFFVEGEFPGEHRAVMVDPEINSRNGNAKDRTGDFFSPQGDFRETAILAANLSLFDQGKLSEEEVLKQYDGYVAGSNDGIEGLRAMLGRRLGRIKYGELERVDAIEKREAARPEMVLIPELSATGEVDTHHFRLGTRADLQAQQVQIQEAESKKTKRRIKVIAACGAVLVTTTACASVLIHPTDAATPEVPIRTQTATNPVPGQSTETPAAPVETATQIPTETMTATATAEADRYTIDMERFLRAAPSYEYMVAHPEEFQEAPDLLSDVEAFKDWYYTQYVPALLLGHEERMTDMANNEFSRRNLTNVTMFPGAHNGDGNYSFVALGERIFPPTSEIPLAYFIHDGVLYPILAFTVDIGMGNAGTYSIILHPETLYSDGFDAIKYLYDGMRVQEITQETNVGEGTEDTELVREFLNDGFNWQADLLRVGPFFNIGLGKMVLIK